MINQPTSRSVQAGQYRLPLGAKTYIMGIINVTPDSFSDGGRYFATEDALIQARSLIDAGADILDIGGESTRPGSDLVSSQTEIKRVLPVIAQLAGRFDVPLSIDTFKADVAEAALSAGASIVNDVTGLLADPQMAAVVASHRAGLILMHNAVLYRQGHPAASIFTNLPVLPECIRSAIDQTSLISAVRSYLRLGYRRAQEAGVSRDQIILDPGVGFGLRTEESLELIDRLRDIQILDEDPLPLLVGPSRKRFIGDLLNRAISDRAVGTAAAVAASIARGADFVRVHDVELVAQTTQICDAIFRR